VSLIPTPVGDYNPDWAIAFHEGTVKHIYFVAETTGTMSTLGIKGIEKAKIDCATRFFDMLTARHNGEVVYKQVDGFDKLMQLVST